jgi:hypothetical protein
MDVKVTRREEEALVLFLGKILCYITIDQHGVLVGVCNLAILLTKKQQSFCHVRDKLTKFKL